MFAPNEKDQPPLPSEDNTAGVRASRTRKAGDLEWDPSATRPDWNEGVLVIKKVRSYAVKGALRPRTLSDLAASPG